MTDQEKVMSWLEGLSQDDWRQFHSDSEVSNIAKAALTLLKEQQKIINALESDLKETLQVLGEKGEHCEMDESKIIEVFDEAKQEVWTDDDQYTVGYNNGLEAGKNIALALLKPRILTLDEALGSDDPVYFESNNRMECWVDAYISDDLQCAVFYRFRATEFMLPLSRYKKDWRCWSAPPSYEQSKEVKWE